MTDDREIFDATLVRQRMARAVASPEFPGFLFERANEELLDRLSLIKRQFKSTLVMSDFPAGLAAALEASPQHGTVATANASASYETPDLAPESLDCILSVLNLHSINNLPAVLTRYRQALRPDGLFMAVLLGAGSLGDLRDAWLSAEADSPHGASPRVAPFADIRSLGGLLQHAGFALPVADSDTLVLTYENALAAMREVKAMGWSNSLQARSRVPVTRTLLARAAANHETAAGSSGGRVHISLNLVYLTGWAPHDSQQQPLKPGSATMRLADALKSTGE